MSLKKIALAVAISAATASANAALVLPGSDVNNTGGSELLFMVFDSVNNTTYVRDLNIGYRSFDGNASYNFAADSALSGMLAGGTGDQYQFQWAVIAADSTKNGTNGAGNIPTWGMSVMTTSDLDTVALTNGKVEQSGLMANPVFNEASTTLAAASADSTVGAGSIYDSAFKGNWQGNIPGAGQYLGESAYFLMAQQSVTYRTSPIPGYVIGSTTAAIVSTFAGLWTLSTNGTLSYGVASEVPLPASAWLLASGLAGLAGVARRRKAAQA